MARGFAAAFPGARLELVQNANHYVQLDQPGAVVDAIQAVLAR